MVKQKKKGITRECEAFSQRNLKSSKEKLRQFVKRTAIGSSSEQERKVNALASGADEGRD